MLGRRLLVLFIVLALGYTQNAIAKPPRGPDKRVTIALESPGLWWFDEEQSLLEAAQLAVDDRGGRVCGGWSVSVEAHATDFSALKQAANARHDLADPTIGAILGTYTSGLAMELLPIVNPGHMLVVSPANTAPCLTVATADCSPDALYPSGVRNYVRVIGHDLTQGTVQARLAKSLGSVVLIASIDDAYGRSLGGAVQAEAEALGIPIAASVRYPWPGDDGALLPVAVKKLLDALHESTLAPDVIVMAGFEEAAELTQALRAAGYDGAIIVGDGALGPSFAATVGADASVFATMVGVTVEGLGADVWAQRFSTRTGREPAFYTPYAYAAAEHILDAFDAACAAGFAPTDREAVRAAGLDPSTLHRSVIGAYRVDASGDVSPASVSLFTLASGEWAFVGAIH